MEQIYTIPVNEAFEEGRDNHIKGCPFCNLYARLEKNEIDLILGASMMEPDVRQKTNEQGFCKNHFIKLLTGGKRLPLALILESHLAEIDTNMKKPGLVPVLSGGEAAKKLAKLSGDCYICSRIEYNFSKMIETAALLWENDEAFRQKCAAQPYFCLPHFAGFVAAAKDRMKAKLFGEFYRQVYELENGYLAKLSGDMSWFVKKFDYRYAEEPWYEAKDAIERTLAFISGTDVPQNKS